MIGGDVVVSDDSLLVFPIFSEVPEQRFASCWIEKECCLRGLGDSLVIGELAEGLMHERPVCLNVVYKTGT